jgi:energy-coupling factor transporter transmembrane protein EcfT
MPTTAETAQDTRWIGTSGCVALLVWTFLVIFLLPAGASTFAAAVVMAAGGVIQPAAFRRLLRLRWMLLAALLLIPNMLWVYAPDVTVAHIPVSLAGAVVGLRMVLNAFVVILVIDIFSCRVAITEVAGLLERLGLKGLGFSMGIAVNVLPSLRESSDHAWHSLRMRGGFQAQRALALRYLLITIITNTLTRAEEIALAAEARAFAPENACALPLAPGILDRWLGAGCLLTLAGLLLLAVL